MIAATIVDGTPHLARLDLEDLRAPYLSILVDVGGRQIWRVPELGIAPDLARGRPGGARS